MKKIFLVILILPIISLAQNNDNTVFANKLRAGSGFILPKFEDTTAASSSQYKDSVGALIFTTSDTKVWKRTTTAWVEIGAGGGGGTWGSITGTLSSQTDLQSALDAKVPTTTTVNGHALSANVTVTQGDVGLGNVDNTSDATKNSATATLTNKRITKRTGTTASSATPTINTDNVDFYSITALAANITSFTTNLSGSPTEGQTLWIAITDNGTPRTLAFGTSFEASTVPLPTTTVASTRLDCLFVWNSVTSRWRIIACQ